MRLAVMGLGLLTVACFAAKSETMREPNPQVSPVIDRSGSEFLEACKYVDNANVAHTFDIANCLGWVDGFMEGVRISDEFRTEPKEKGMTCPPAQVSVLQLERVIKKYIEERPERQHLPTRYLASEALIKAFPCQ